MLLTFKQIISYLPLMGICCTPMYLTKAMEESIAKRRKIENHQEYHVSPLENVPSELKVYIISFLVSAENQEKAIESIKALSQTSKSFYSFINDTSVLGNLIKEISNQFGQSPIDIAIGFRNPGAANWLKGYSQNNLQVKESLNSGLLQFAQSGDSILTQFFLNTGADVNKVDKTGRTPLHWVAINGHAAIVELLLEYGADVNKVDNNDNIPLFTAAYSNADKDTVELLLKAGTNVNQTDKNGNTLLYLAATQSKTGTVKLLLNAGADVNQVDKYGDTPLAISANEGHKDIVELLLNAGATINQVDNERYTPLFLATWSGHKEIVESLLKAGADVNTADRFGDTPLHLAAIKGYKDIVELLLNAGAAVNTIDT
jgi:ankyrin repeat protein